MPGFAEQTLKKCNVFGVSAIYINSGILSCHPQGILWQIFIYRYITVVHYDDKRMIGCKLCISNNVHLFVNVYNQCYDNFDDYRHYIGKLIDVLHLVYFIYIFLSTASVSRIK